jgi:hypothetical protein
MIQKIFIALNHRIPMFQRENSGFPFATICHPVEISCVAISLHQPIAFCPLAPEALLFVKNIKQFLLKLCLF